jgi:hypothetical protein
MEKRKKRFDKNPKKEMDEKPPEIKWTLGRRRKNSPAKTPFEKKKSGKMESKIN